MSLVNTWQIVVSKCAAHLMVTAVMVSDLPTACTKVFFEERIDDNLFARRVASNLPDQLVSPSFLGIDVSPRASISVLGIIVEDLW